VALFWKMICNLGDPISLRHPVVAQDDKGGCKISQKSA